MALQDFEFTGLLQQWLSLMDETGSPNSLRNGAIGWSGSMIMSLTKTASATVGFHSIHHLKEVEDTSGP